MLWKCYSIVLKPSDEPFLHLVCSFYASSYSDHFTHTSRSTQQCRRNSSFKLKHVANTFKKYKSAVTPAWKAPDVEFTASITFSFTGELTNFSGEAELITELLTCIVTRCCHSLVNFCLIYITFAYFYLIFQQLFFF